MEDGSIPTRLDKKYPALRYRYFVTLDSRGNNG